MYRTETLDLDELNIDKDNPRITRGLNCIAMLQYIH